MIDYATEIKSAVRMRDVCARYGVDINHRGYCLCPFHGEKTPSMRIKDDKYKCFGCGAYGDVIDFTGELLGLSFQDSLKRLSDDFALNLPLDGEADEDARREAEERTRRIVERRRTRQRAVQRANTACEIAMSVYAYYDTKRRESAPDSIVDDFTEEYADAVRKLPMIEYQLDRAEMNLAELMQYGKRNRTAEYQGLHV